jgi:hypothetical protein
MAAAKLVLAKYLTAPIFKIVSAFGAEHMQDQSVSGATAGIRRSGTDRRAKEFQRSPWEYERRHKVERRLPIIVDESAASFADWAKSMAIFLAKKRERVKAIRSVRSVKPKKW